MAVTRKGFDAGRATRQVLRLLRDNGFRVSVFHNPGSLHGTMPAHVEAHAVRSGDPVQFWMMRVYNAEHEHPEYTCVCRLAEACGFDLQ